MTIGPDLQRNLADHGPHSLWEAMNLLAYLHEQQARTLQAGDRAGLNRVVSLQTRTWAYVRSFAEEMVAGGEVPPDLVERLRRSLHLPATYDRALSTARDSQTSRLAASPPSEEYRRAA